MAAVNAARIVPTATGDQIVARQILYRCAHSLLTSWLPRYKIPTDFCDLTKPESVTKVATQNCQVVYLETSPYERHRRFWDRDAWSGDRSRHLLQSSDAVAQGFWKLAVSQECVANPGVRLADAGGADDKPAEKRDAAGGIFAKVRRVVFPGLANFAQHELAYPQMTTLDGSFAPATCGILNCRARTAM
jgi:hypothetical protein